MKQACAAAAVLALAAPSLAAAQTPPATPAVTVDATCYTPGEQINETAS